MAINILNTGQPFSFSMRNPNPKARPYKDGMKYILEVELVKEEWDDFAEGYLPGMVIEVERARVTHSNEQAVGGEIVAPGASEGPSRPHQKQGDKWSSLAHLLHSRGYFRASPLWAAMDKSGLYTQATHKTHIEKLPCWFVAHSGAAQIACSGPADGGEGDRISVGHHVRTAANSGTGIKPDDWYLLPVCDSHHKFCHSKDANREFKDMLLMAAVQITADQIKYAMKFHMEIESFTGITELRMREFEESIGHNSHFKYGDAHGP